MNVPRKVGGVGAGAAALLYAAYLAAPMIYQFEGDERIGYVDPVGVPTACSGHTRGAVVGRKYSTNECLSHLVIDAAEHAANIAGCIAVPVEDIPPQSLAAFVDFTYNFGAPKFCSSTLNKKLNAGDLLGACAELSRWNKGHVLGALRELPGLTRRRAAERDWCERGARGGSAP